MNPGGSWAQALKAALDQTNSPQLGGTACKWVTREGKAAASDRIACPWLDPGPIHPDQAEPTFLFVPKGNQSG